VPCDPRGAPDQWSWLLETMADVVIARGVPEHIRSDNGAEMTAKIVRH
jgi:putative transposase